MLNSSFLHPLNQMAWGLWNKIKKGFQKVGRALKKGVTWVNDKILKPFKPVIKTAANVLLPGVGGKIVDTVSDGIDAVDKGGVKGALAWGANQFKK